MVLNKGDLVSEDQTADILEKIKLIQPRDKIIKSTQSKVDVKDILDTKLFKADQNKDEFWITASKTAAEKIFWSIFIFHVDEHKTTRSSQYWRSIKQLKVTGEH